MVSLRESLVKCNQIKHTPQRTQLQPESNPPLPAPRNKSYQCRVWQRRPTSLQRLLRVWSFDHGKLGSRHSGYIKLCPFIPFVSIFSCRFFVLFIIYSFYIFIIPNLTSLERNPTTLSHTDPPPHHHTPLTALLKKDIGLDPAASWHHTVPTAKASTCVAPGWRLSICQNCLGVPSIDITLR